jgi:hypothetical protein
MAPVVLNPWLRILTFARGSRGIFRPVRDKIQCDGPYDALAIFMDQHLLQTPI